jgi:hypothetical protein
MSKSPEDYAREAVADHDALRSTDERTRPVAITSDHERLARGSQSFEITTERQIGEQTHQTVHRVTADSADDAVASVTDQPDDVIAVEPLPDGSIRSETP